MAIDAVADQTFFLHLLTDLFLEWQSLNGANFREFRRLSLELLDHCYQHDDAQTLQLLTYELSNWGNETCLSLSVMVNNKQFLAHPWLL